MAWLRAQSCVPAAAIRARPSSAVCPHLARGFAAGGSRLSYDCDLDEEPVQCYKPGGYHPIHIGDRVKDGQYKILHKLGWGAFSTVWAARDKETNQNVAVKILQAAASGKDRELRTLQSLKQLQRSHRGYQHLNSLHDSFQQRSPNGLHDCLVLDLTGPSVQGFIGHHIEDGRLPGKQAKLVARQALQALACLHEQNIGHGDVHLHNIVLGIPSLPTASEADLATLLGNPVTAPIRPDPNNTPEVPRYIVKPTSFSSRSYLSLSEIKLVDFGASFSHRLGPGSLLNPPIVRPPEAIFGNDPLDKQVDLWSMGCTLFELICGQTPFESGLGTTESIARQMVHLVRDDFPARWKAQRAALDQPDSSLSSASASSLQQWLALLYFDREQTPDFSRDEIAQAGDLVARLMRFEPEKRASAEEILRDPWFKDVQ
ncbi:kinase-like protein [Myriangium duriaei CBS 260.36]|uniref:Kinase-like protein n=1 Tax=Myriangium duriaei CBS 260.36 TaxID=1168546 RepID=A0A9P4MLH3_9PEZI|nr:kinase-like protein [Myriangium duriaei CBS 260.36]